MTQAERLRLLEQCKRERERGWQWFTEHSACEPVDYGKRKPVQAAIAPEKTVAEMTSVGRINLGIYIDDSRF